MEVTGISLTPVQTMGQKLAKAGQNTVISMSIVFCVLILISLIIYCFKFIALIGNKPKKAEAKKAQKEAQKERLLQQHLLQTLQMIQSL